MFQGREGPISEQTLGAHIGMGLYGPGAPSESCSRRVSRGNLDSSRRRPRYCPWLPLGSHGVVSVTTLLGSPWGLGSGPEFSPKARFGMARILTPSLGL
jgi:hypothetical protein